jgi:hypothetical protein
LPRPPSVPPGCPLRAVGSRRPSALGVLWCPAAGRCRPLSDNADRASDRVVGGVPRGGVTPYRPCTPPAHYGAKTLGIRPNPWKTAFDDIDSRHSGLMICVEEFSDSGDVQAGAIVVRGWGGASEEVFTYAKVSNITPAAEQRTLTRRATTFCKGDASAYGIRAKCSKGLGAPNFRRHQTLQRTTP